MSAESGDSFLESLMDTGLYSMGAYFCDRHPELVDDVIAESADIERRGLRRYAEEESLLEECFQTLSPAWRCATSRRWAAERRPRPAPSGEAPYTAPIGAWRSLVARTVRVGEVPGSNPGAPMTETPRGHRAFRISGAGRRPAEDQYFSFPAAARVACTVSLAGEVPVSLNEPRAPLKRPVPPVTLAAPV